MRDGVYHRLLTASVVLYLTGLRQVGHLSISRTASRRVMGVGVRHVGVRHPPVEVWAPRVPAL